MSLAWIRVNASLLDDPTVREFGKALYPKLPPFTARAAAAGHLVAFWGHVAKHQPDGCLRGREEEQLEEWAQWKGPSGQFATLFLRAFVDEACVILLWDEYQGAALARREADRLRKSTTRKQTVHRLSAPPPPEFVRTSRRNGTGTVTVTNSGTAGPRGNVENPERSSGVLPGTATATATPSGVVQRFTVRFYGRATPERRMDVARQMAGAMLSTGVEFKGSLVRAVDAEHLDDACLAVMENPPRDSNAAWVFVLTHLRDTRLEVLSARAKALVLPRPTSIPDGMAGDAPAGATPLRAALAGVLDGLDHDEGPA